MINSISVENSRNINSREVQKRKNAREQANPNFKAGGSILLQGMQACERIPMVNVAVIDLLSAILPRTIVESMTNCFAGFEALRRESSGLIVNCMIPGFITLGLAKMFNGGIMPKGSNMSECWADSSLINKAKDYYLNANSQDKYKECFTNILGNIEGHEGKNKVLFKEAFSAEELDKYAQKLSDLSKSNLEQKEISKQVKELVKEVIEKTNVSENVKIADNAAIVKASSVDGMLQDSVKFFNNFHKAGTKVSIEEFAKRSRALVTAKSVAGLAVVLPLAISMQYINRWITGKVSGVKGAPIYDDFGKGSNLVEENPKSKEGLLKQKVISISAMLGVSMLSLMKKPTWGMLEFKGPFPTMDQARVISTATFASRMAAADDKNELAESTWRDIATFMGLYFLGAYASKGTATWIQKHMGIELLNDTKPISKDANALKKFAHWVKDVNVKSSDEVVSKTAKELKKKGILPDKHQLETIAKELQKARNMRSACQAADIGVSLALLGIIVPICTRKNTKKKHEQALKLAQENNIQTEKDDKTIALRA